ncbi:hypothetical protein HOO68_06065 [Candidatus Gracilibacteria bacterium]|nr:hypothetical protein [Candidatus Gracilibacteria bacterium]
MYLPHVGCGNGGLDWKTDVRPVIEQYLTVPYVVIQPKGGRYGQDQIFSVSSSGQSFVWHWRCVLGVLQYEHYNWAISTGPAI